MSRTLLEEPGLTELALIIHKDNECGLADVVDVKSPVVLVPEFAVWTMACSQSNKGAATRYLSTIQQTGQRMEGVIP